MRQAALRCFICFVLAVAGCAGTVQVPAEGNGRLGRRNFHMTITRETSMFVRIIATVLAGLAMAGSAYAQLLTERKVFTLPQYTTVGGKTIRNVRIGYESYGKLNAAGDNAIYIAHFLTANSHAAGQYKADDKIPGYWDSIIGPGKPFDTDRYFVLSADTLVNVNARDTGPGSINPETGRPWGMSFPIVTMRDFVNVQKALAD